MHQDRGMIKWNSLMLPEHVEMLRKLKTDDDKMVRPELDPAQMEYYQDILKRALEQRRMVLLHLHSASQIDSVKGIPIKTNRMPMKNQLNLKLKDGKTTTILFSDIVHAELE